MSDIHIFRSGTHTDMLGRSVTVSDADLCAMAQTYDPAKHEAPVVAGHPATDAPAYGWIKSLRAEGGNLFAEPHQLDPAFCELVSQHRYKKISPAFYSPGTPGNPVPGQFYLKHVGFLGAVPPAVKGLQQVQFADGEDVLEFADWSQQTTATLFSRLRDFFIAQFGLEKADSVMPDYLINDLRDDAMRPAEPVAPDQTAFSEADHPAEKTAPETPPSEPDEEKPVDKPETDNPALAAENAALKQQLADLKSQQAQAETAKRHADSVAFAEQLISQAKLAPAGKGVLVAVLDALSGSEEALMYAEGDSQKPLASAFRDLLSACQPVLQFAEVANHDAAAPQQAGDLAFAGAEPSRLTLHSKARALAKTENITYEAAVRRLI